MKTFKTLLEDLAEKETDAEYNLRMRKGTRQLKINAKKGKKRKKINVVKRRDDEKLDAAAKAKAKRFVLRKLAPNTKPSVRKDKKADKQALIDREGKKMKRDLKKAEPERIKQAKLAKVKK
jgi:esterase/lipase superfamily enzyme